jgi:hypothetical protein
VNLFLHENALGSPDTCNREATGLPLLPVSWSPTLFSGTGPVGLPPIPRNDKSNWKFSIFFSEVEVIGATETWLKGKY